jgi:hypothetical protein
VWCRGFVKRHLLDASAAVPSDGECASREGSRNHKRLYRERRGEVLGLAER